MYMCAYIYLYVDVCMYMYKFYLFKVHFLSHLKKKIYIDIHSLIIYHERYPSYNGTL